MPRVAGVAGRSVGEYLRRPEVEFSQVAPLVPEIALEIGERVEIDLKLEGYVGRVETAIARAARDEATVVPSDFDFAAVRQLSREAREKFARHRPRSLGAASRISGITPADIGILTIVLHAQRRGTSAEETA
jgi:tRNA uridine 5-carboxymethylaminomethyl modification enzyme